MSCTFFGVGHVGAAGPARRGVMGGLDGRRGARPQRRLRPDHRAHTPGLAHYHRRRLPNRGVAAGALHRARRRRRLQLGVVAQGAAEVAPDQLRLDPVDARVLHPELALGERRRVADDHASALRHRRRRRRRRLLTGDHRRQLRRGAGRLRYRGVVDDDGAGVGGPSGRAVGSRRLARTRRGGRSEGRALRTDAGKTSDDAGGASAVEDAGVFEPARDFIQGGLRGVDLDGRRVRTRRIQNGL